MSDAQPRGLIDYHLHTGVTIDAKMKEIDACERALSRGIREIAFTNHVMLNQPNYLMSPQACAAHWERVQECQERYPGLTIRLGLEVDYYPGSQHEIAGVIREYEELIGRPFDLILGSVHELNGVFFSNKQQAPALYKDRYLADLYREYFALATEAVYSRLFDVMAHPDLIKKYVGELTPTLDFAQYASSASSYVDALLETGIGMEVNTKGLKLKVNEAYPSGELLRMYVSRAAAAGIDPVFSLGSDAHSVEDVGDFIAEGAALLRSLGVVQIARFQAHRRSPWML